MAPEMRCSGTVRWLQGRDETSGHHQMGTGCRILLGFTQFKDTASRMQHAVLTAMAEWNIRCIIMHAGAAAELETHRRCSLYCRIHRPLNHSRRLGATSLKPRSFRVCAHAGAQPCVSDCELELPPASLQGAGSAIEPHSAKHTSLIQCLMIHTMYTCLRMVLVN